VRTLRIDCVSFPTGHARRALQAFPLFTRYNQTRPEGLHTARPAMLRAIVQRGCMRFFDIKHRSRNGLVPGLNMTPDLRTPRSRYGRRKGQFLRDGLAFPDVQSRQTIASAARGIHLALVFDFVCQGSRGQPFGKTIGPRLGDNGGLRIRSGSTTTLPALARSSASRSANWARAPFIICPRRRRS